MSTDRRLLRLGIETITLNSAQTYRRPRLAPTDEDLAVTLLAMLAAIPTDTAALLIDTSVSMRDAVALAKRLTA